MKNKLIGIIGLSIPFLFVIGFTIFFIFINPSMFNPSGGIFLVGYNLPELTGLYWVKYFNYLGIGLLTIVFSISILFITDNSGTNKIGKILLILSGFCWFSFGIISISDSNLDAILLILRIIITLCLGSFGFLLLASDFNKITPGKTQKRLLFSVGLLIILSGVFDFIMMSHIPDYIGYLTWLIYFMGYGIIGIAVFKSIDTMHYVAHS